jgi:hypothetical protein
MTALDVKRADFRSNKAKTNVEYGFGLKYGETIISKKS